MRDVVLSVLLTSACLSLQAGENLLPQAPLLPNPAGRVVRVADINALRQAVEHAQDGDTILLADGTYVCDKWIWIRNKKNLTLRGASNDPAKAILRGKGFAGGGDDDDIIWLDKSENVTFAYLTFTETPAYGLKINAEGDPRNIKVYNCHFRDIGVRGIKGTRGDIPSARVHGGEVRYCYFENTKVPSAEKLDSGNYITSIDMMRLENWTFADNVFKNIKGRTGMGRGAIFIWVESKGLTIERNLFVDCDRGVCIGNPSNSLPTESVICRNNVFTTTSPDSQIEISAGFGVKVYNNTVFKKEPKGRGIRVVAGITSKDIEIANNICNGDIELNGAKAENNYAGALEGYFADPNGCNFRLTALAVGAINKGLPFPEVKADFDGCARDATPDIGACEFGASKPVAETAMSPSSGTPKDPQAAASTPAPPPKPVVPAIDLTPHKDAITAALKKEAKANSQVFVRVFGKVSGVVLQSVDEKGINVLTDGNSLPIRWKDLNEDDYAQLAWGALHDNADALFHAGVLCSGHNAPLLEKIRLELFKVNADKARALDTLASAR